MESPRRAGLIPFANVGWKRTKSQFTRQNIVVGMGEITHKRHRAHPKHRAAMTPEGEPLEVVLRDVPIPDETGHLPRAGRTYLRGDFDLITDLTDARRRPGSLLRLLLLRPGSHAAGQLHNGSVSLNLHTARVDPCAPL